MCAHVGLGYGRKCVINLVNARKAQQRRMIAQARSTVFRMCVCVFVFNGVAFNVISQACSSSCIFILLSGESPASFLLIAMSVCLTPIELLKMAS